ncbi:MAG TPA: hypothetical protein VNO31_05820 [Umezawaea sp.]|nr:hypothetical protein [Umezawaea sp.]
MAGTVCAGWAVAVGLTAGTSHHFCRFPISSGVALRAHRVRVSAAIVSSADLVSSHDCVRNSHQSIAAEAQIGDRVMRSPI